MKIYATMLGAILLCGATVQGAVFYSGTDPSSSSNPDINLEIPDGNPTGIYSSINASELGTVFVSVTVTINVTGGARGDLVCYLTHGSSSATLLNRIGATSENPFGDATAGFTGYTFSGTSLNSSFSGNPNGNWTLSFFDMAGGNSPSTLNNWSLDITAVPEPVNMALGILGGLGVALAGWRSQFWRLKSRKS